VIQVGPLTVTRQTFEPGWKWSEHVKATAGTDSCQTHHHIYVLAGNLKAVMDDGEELEAATNDMIDIPPGHDAWVVGDKAFVGLDISTTT
jgi:quercetin dioxygenase-like cupin family protein